MSQENVEAFKRDLDAFRRGDFDAWVGSFHAECDFVPRRAPIQGSYRGHAALRGFLADNAESFDLFDPAYEHVRDIGDHVLAIGTLRVRGKESGVEVEVPSALVVTYRDGKAIRFEDFGDKREALKAVGLSEQDAHADS
jgi:ketosteroid isomerase-like protein